MKEDYMIRHAECTRNKKQNRRNYKGFVELKQDITLLTETKKKEIEYKY